MQKLILGPPGTGKTHFLTHKVIPKLKGRTYVFSFTKAGAKEISARLKERPAFVGTVHSFAFKACSLIKAQVMDSTKQFFEEVGEVPAYKEHMAEYYICREKRQGMTSGLIKNYESYKEQRGLYDFPDMLEEACEAKHAPVDNIVIDEGQDLTPLQWELIQQIPCTNIIVAGDDDQSIYDWMGAATLKADMFEEVEVLSKSYRLPLHIHKYALKILQGIQSRNIKEFSPRDELGEVEFLSSYFDLMGNREDLTILVRDNYTKKEIEDFCLQYLIPLKKVLEGKLAKAFVKGTAYAGKEIPLKYINYLSYFSGPEKKNLPMWEVRTIHSSKGMEWDNVAIICDLEGKPTDALSSQEGRDAEARVWYVAVTRAKETLKIVGYNLFMPTLN